MAFFNGECQPCACAMLFYYGDSVQPKWQTLKKRADFVFIRHKGVSASRKGIVIQAMKVQKEPLRCGRKDFVVDTAMASPSDKTIPHCEQFSEHATPSNIPPHGPLRVGFTATKKIGNAVVRNRAKRRLRALVDTVIIPHADKHYDYVLIARHHTATRPWQQLQNDVKHVLQDLNLYT